MCPHPNVIIFKELCLLPICAGTFKLFSFWGWVKNSMGGGGDFYLGRNFIYSPKIYCGKEINPNNLFRESIIPRRKFNFYDEIWYKIGYLNSIKSNLVFSFRDILLNRFTFYDSLHMNVPFRISIKNKKLNWYQTFYKHVLLFVIT